MRGIATSSTARSTSVASASSHRLGAVAGLGDHRQVGLGVEHHAQAAADHRVVVGEQDPRLQRDGHPSPSGQRHVEAHLGPAAGGRARPSAGRRCAARARACRRCRRRRRPASAAARAVVAHDQPHAAAVHAAQRRPGPAWRRRGASRWSGSPGRRGRDQLDLGAQRRRRPGRAGAPRSGRRAPRPRCRAPRRALWSPRSSSTSGRSSRAIRRTSSSAAALSRRRGARPGACVELEHHAASAPGRPRRAARARSAAARAPGRSARRPLSRRSCSSRSSMSLNAVVSAVDLGVRSGITSRRPGSSGSTERIVVGEPPQRRHEAAQQRAR